MKGSIRQSSMCTNPANHKYENKDGQMVITSFWLFHFFKHCFHKIHLKGMQSEYGASVTYQWSPEEKTWCGKPARCKLKEGRHKVISVTNDSKLQKHFKSFSHLLFDVSRWNKVFHSLALWLIINGPTKTQTRLWDMLKLSICPVKETISLE